MLETPLGIIEILVDDVPHEYEYISIPLDKTCPDLNARYSISICFEPDGKEHTISCQIYDYVPSEDDGIESGERLELYSFYKDSVKLSIGMEGDTGYINNQRISDYDYDTEYLHNGVQYNILRFSKTSKYVFGIAWITPVTEDNDVQTWFGADPTMF